MAIQCSVTTIQGIPLSTAYINLNNPQIIKTRTASTATPPVYTNTYSFAANAQIYASQTVYNSGNAIPIEGFSVTCPCDITQNAIEQGYVALKTNARLSNITDIF
jgi:hypothetical protein